MEHYDSSFTAQLLPLLACSLGTTPVSETLKKHLDKAQPSNDIWDNVIIKNRLSAAKFRIVYNESEDIIESKITAHKSQAADTHSPLSPFNASSDLFPSGVISSKWFRKYVADIPFTAICVYELSSNAEDSNLAENLAVLRRKYLGYNTRFIAIIVSNSKAADLKDRLAYLRQTSGLANLQGFFHLSSSEESLESDCEVLVSSLLNTLKHSAVDFYSSIESRVRQRSTKYYTMPRSEIKTSIELSPKILETRNLVKQGVLLQLMHPHNLEPALQVLENSYEHLLDLISHNISHFFSKSRTPHDRKVYVQWCALLDAIAIHIIRGYFSLEQPVTAIKKHESHIRSVVQLLSTQTPNISLWVAVQKHWLADILALVPESALQDFHISSNKNKKSGAAVEYFGGLLTPDFTPIITAPSLVYQSAAVELELVKEEFKSNEFLKKHFDSYESVLRYKITLLERARSSSTVQKATAFASLELQLLSHMGDAFVSLQEYEKAVEVYQLAQNKCLLPAWDILKILAKKVIHAAEKSGNTALVLQQLVGLSLNGLATEMQIPNKLELPQSSSVDLDNQGSLVSVSVSVFSLSKDEEVRVSDTITTQIKITSTFDPATFKKMYPGSECSISLNHIDIFDEKESQVRLGGGGTQPEYLQASDVTNGEAQFNFASFGKESLVFQINHEALKSGWFSVSRLLVSCSVTVSLSGKSLVLNKNEVVTMDHGKIAHTYEIYQNSNNGAITKSTRKLGGRSPYRLYVKPFRPSVDIDFQSNAKSIIIGEKFEAPAGLSFPEKLKVNGCKSLKLVVESIIYDDMIETKDLRAHVNWDSLKDDEPIELMDEFSKSEKQHILHVKITRPPSTKIPDEGSLKLVVYFKLVVASDDSEASEFDLKQVDFTILPKPFSETFEIVPRVLTEKLSSIANPFLLDTTSDNFSMPLISRAWLLRMKLANIDNISERDDVEIVKATLNVRSANPGVKTTWLNEPTQEKGTYTQEFMTDGEHHPTTSSVTVFANASYTYKRKGAFFENSVETEEKEFVLALQEPRVLLEVIPEDKTLCLRYTIENPTSRIFTFSSTLSSENASQQGVVWTFDDVRNESPIKHTIIPVLPFSEHVLSYHATYKTDELKPKNIVLPSLQVYDMHYKVSLPTISLQDSVTETEAGMAFKL